MKHFARHAIIGDDKLLVYCYDIKMSRRYMEDGKSNFGAAVVTSQNQTSNAWLLEEILTI